MSEPDFDAGLADTSIFIARESGRELQALPPLLAVSVVTIGELRLGVLAARTPKAKARRADTLALARAADPLPANEAVLEAWARVVAATRAAGLGPRVKVTDALIAATAIEHGLPVVTQDRDFGLIASAVDELDVLVV